MEVFGGLLVFETQPAFSRDSFVQEMPVPIQVLMTCEQMYLVTLSLILSNTQAHTFSVKGATPHQTVLVFFWFF